MEKYLALKASAGSGKTFALTIRYLSLLLLDISPKEILTLTFTNKAALEMSERIYKTLFNLGNDKTIVDAIAIQTNLTSKEILLKKDEVINRFVSSELSIYTIDKFINKILREFSGYANISDDFIIEYDNDELLLYKFLISLDEKKFDKLIDFAHTENKKLNSIITLFKTLDEKNEFLEIKSIHLDDYDLCKQKIISGATKIKQFILDAQLSNSAKKAVDFNTIDELLSKGKTWLTKDTLQEFTYFKKVTIPNELEEYFNRLKQDIIFYYQAKESIVLSHLFEIFNDFKYFRDTYNKNKNTLEFNDITNIVYELLQKHIDKDFLYFRLDSNYTSILIDEFQDTSILQYKILEPLIEEIMSGNDEKLKTFFYVGDTKQSIYRFRGGTKELFDFVANKYQDELKVEILDTNYRSGKNVVEFVNKNFNNVVNYEYYSQKVNSKIDGLVEVVDFLVENDNSYEQIGIKIDQLIKQGIDVNNIAILTYTNADVLNLYLYLKKIFPTLSITTEMTSKLINEQNIQAVINAIKYLYFKEDIYKSNFNALIGEDFFTLWESNIIYTDVSIPSLIKDIAITFNIMDQNILKFIELASDYDNIIDFIYNIDRLDASRVFKDKNGIQILTVFKSKGLEFDTVLVLDRIKRKNTDRSSLLFKYDNINLTNIFHKSSSRENFGKSNMYDQAYQDAIEKEKKLNIDDELNILYVALTRAKNNMIIFKKSKNSVFDLLGDTCSLQTIGKLYIQKQSNYKLKDIVDVEYIPLHLGQQDKQLAKEELSEITIRAKYFGIATHYCLEMMIDFSQISLDKTIDIVKNKYSYILVDKDFDDIYNRISLLIINKDFQDIISNSEYTKEQSLIFDREIKILDLLIKKENQYIIVDYKTTLEKRIDHKQQVYFYKDAISKIVQSDNVEAYLVYLQKDNISMERV